MKMSAWQPPLADIDSCHWLPQWASWSKLFFFFSSHTTDWAAEWPSGPDQTRLATQNKLSHSTFYVAARTRTRKSKISVDETGAVTPPVWHIYVFHTLYFFIFSTFLTLSWNQRCPRHVLSPPCQRSTPGTALQRDVLFPFLFTLPDQRSRTRSKLDFCTVHKTESRTHTMVHF